MQGPATIVVDTNFVSRGRYQGERLRRIAAKLVSRDHEVVVPEVVAWEWTQHLHRTMTLTSRNLRRASDEVRASGLSLDVADMRIPEPDQLLRMIKDDLESMDGVRVEAPIRFDAEDAIKAQVLQVRTGSVKQGVKTGAADALVLAALARERENCSATDAVVLCSNDDLLVRSAVDVPGTQVIRTMRDLWRWHGTTTPSTEELQSAIERWLESSIDEWRLGETGAGFPLDRLDLTRSSTRLLRDAADLPHDGDGYSLDAIMRFVDDCDVVDLELVDDDVLPHVVVATVRSSGTVMLEDWRFSDDGDLECLTGDLDVEIEAPLLVGFDVDWKLADVDTVDPPIVRPRDPHSWGQYQVPPGKRQAS